MTEVEDSRRERDFLNSLKAAVVANDVTKARRLIKGGVDVNKSYWYDGTLLHEAVLSGSKEIIELLLNAKIDVNAQNKDGRTPLHLASRSGRQDIVSLLLQGGADTDVTTWDKRTPLHVATWRGHYEIVHQLVEAGAKVDEADKDGSTPLHWAIYSRSLPMVRLLVERGAKIYQRSLLEKSIWRTDDTSILRYLLQEGLDFFHLHKSYYFMKIIFPESSFLEEIHRDMSAVKSNYAGGFGDLSASATVKQLVEAPKTVYSLAAYCGKTVRLSLITANAGRSISKAVKGLPIPEHVKGFLLYDHLKK